MQMGVGVEWAIHSCLNLAWTGEPVSTARLAGHFDLPSAYLNKQLQELVRAGLLTSVPGPRGGFRLAREPGDISLLDVVVALEGREEAFRCTRILARAPNGDPDGDYRRRCAVSRSMRRAELAWRRELASRSLADLDADVRRDNPDAPDQVRAALITRRTGERS